MPYVTGQDLKNDVLFRGGEAQGSASGWNSKAIDYLNRAYKSLCAGASEFLPEVVEDWWWLRKRGVLTLLPVFSSGSVTVSQGSDTITFSVAPTSSLAGRILKVDGNPEIYNISAHTASTTNATLDATYNGDSGSGKTFRAMLTSYALASDVAALIGPMFHYRGTELISGMSPEAMDSRFPPSLIEPGVPTAFSLDNTQTVRFNAGGLTSTISIRAVYRYRQTVADLSDSPGSVPLVPEEYRPLICDMALAYLFRDKNDTRDQSVGLSARNGLKAMVAENRRRLSKMSTDLGKIQPRTNGQKTASLRTDSGLIIG